MREGQTLFTYLHLAASTGRAPTPCIEHGVTGIAYETVELADRSLPLLAPMSEVAGRHGAAGRRRHAAARGRRPRRADGRRLRRLGRQGRRHRRRRLRHERRGDRPRHAGRGHRCWTRTSTGCARWTGSTRATCRPSRRTRTRSSAPCSTPTSSSAPCSCPGAKAPKLVTNELVSRMKPGLGARRHLHRPGRLLRGLAPDHARRPDVQGPRLGLLLRREHARRGAAHLDVRADQRHAAVRRRAGRTRAGATRCGTTTRWRWA